MALSQFPPAMQATIVTTSAVAATLRAVRDGSGPIPWATMTEAQLRLRRAKAAGQTMVVEAQKALPAAQSHMAGIGGPGTLAEFVEQMQGVETAAAAWNAYLETLPAALTGPDLVQMVLLSDGGVESKVWQWAPEIPEDLSASIRSSDQLAALISALEAGGA